MGRTTGLPYHLLYPLISVVLLAIPSFASADGVWYISASTSSFLVRFGALDYCGYTVSNLSNTRRQGCISRGHGWAIPPRYFGFWLPDDINHNLSKVAVTSVIGKSGIGVANAAFSFTLAFGCFHAYTIRYSFRVDPAPDKNKLYSLVQIHVVSVGIIFLFTWVAFVAQAAIIGNAVGHSGSSFGDAQAVAMHWGQSPWLVLGAGVAMMGWLYEAVRWRNAL